jgi:biopolymer transport protein ExbD
MRLIAVAAALLAVALAALLVAACLAAESAPPAAPAAPADVPPGTPATPAQARGRIIQTLPGIVVDTAKREVWLEGAVCRQQAALELFVCSSGSREHESVFVVTAKPSHVVFALSLLGLEPGKPGFTTEGGAFSPPAGEVLSLKVRYCRDGNETVEEPAYKFLRLSGADEGLDRPIDWVFVGRPEAEALRAADREGTVVCLSNFIEAVIDVPFESTSVNTNLLYEANSDFVPKVGTPVHLVIRPVGKRVEPIKVEIEVHLRKDPPLALDGKPVTPDALREAASAMPAAIRSAMLRAEADVPFGRVMQVREILDNALMRTTMAVLPPLGAKAEAAPPAVQILLTDDGSVHLPDGRVTVADLKAKAGSLLRDVRRADLWAESTTPAATVTEVVSALRDAGIAVTLTQGPKQEMPPAKDAGK